MMVKTIIRFIINQLSIIFAIVMRVDQ